jgi:FG-GAP repeat/PEP-CTERM motif
MKCANWVNITSTAAIVVALCLMNTAFASTWSEADKLLASDGVEADCFGQSVSVSGATAIIGAHSTDDKGSYAGSAYVFEKDGSGWSQVAELIADDGAASDYFGISVSISGDVAIVGSHADDDKGSYSGSAYIFERDGSSWSQIAKLTADDGGANDYFATSVSISGNIAIVSSHHDDAHGGSSGSAYIFEKDGSGWAQAAKLTASDAAASDIFGASVSISGSTVVVSALLDDDNGTDSGSAYVFEKDGSGWSQVAKLTADDGAAGAFFGKSVSISGSTIIIGAVSNDSEDTGSAYVFEDDGSGWAQVAKLTADDAAAGDKFGGAVSISGSTAIIGATHDDDNGSASGSAYLFQDDGSGWAQIGKLTASDGAADDVFGYSVSISEGTAVVGAKGDDDNGSYSGSAYTFDVPSSEPVPEPISMIFFGTGVVGVFGFVSRRKMQKVS